MDLFSELNKQQNILPADGIAQYHGLIMERHEADQYYQSLLHAIAWENDRAFILGRTITTKRKVAWYADSPFSYSYSKTTKTALPWIPVLRTLKEIVERESGETYNSCLLNLYHDGSEGMAWHSDAEKELKKDGAIGSLSLGATRKFAFKHKHTKQTIPVILEHGSLLVMKGTTQTHWLHRLPPTKMVRTPRINLTFRTIEYPE